MSTRYERVVLDLEDKLSPGMAKAAASTALLNRELGSLSHDSVRTQRSVSDIDRPVDRLGKSSNSSSREVDKLSGRMRILADVAAILGPSLIPIGAVGIPAVTGLAAQLGFTAGAAGVAVLAFQGVGDALKALNAAALAPTTQNLEKAQVALEGLSPAAQDFVAQLGSMIPELHKLRDVAASGLFPGMTEGLRSMETALPHVQAVVAAIAAELGNIAADAGASLASSKWTDFLDFIAREAPSALAEMATAAGHTAHAVAALWMATDPLNDDFSRWLVNATADLDRWATGLGKTQGFADFLSYVETTGPKVAAAFGAIANAVVQILQAAAPLGGPVLDGVKALADVVAALANSDLGTPLFVAVGALALFNRTLAVTGAMQKATFGGPAIASIKGYSAGIRGMAADFRVLRAEQAKTRELTQGMVPIPLFRKGSEEAKRLSGNLKAVGKTAAGVAGVAIAASGAADKIGLTNTASLGLIGTLGGPWGVAAGAAVGATLDMKDALSDYSDALGQADKALQSNSRAAHEAALASLQQQAQYLATSNSFKANLTRTVSFLKTGLNGIPGNNAGRDLEARAEKLKQSLKMDDARTQQKLLAAGFIATAAGIDRAGQSTKEFQADLQHLNDVLTGRSNLRDYEAALDDFRKSLKENGKTLDINTEKGRNNQAALDNIASSALTMAQKLQGVDRVKFLSAARKQFVDAARDAGMTRKAAQDLATQVLGLNGVKGQPKIVIDANGAWRVIDATAARLERLTRATYILNIKAQTSGKIPQVLDAQAKADGGTVLGPRFPYRDKVVALLAPGEEVITNRHGEADRFRADRAAGRIPAYADGGRVAGTAAMAAGPVIDYDRLASAIARNRLMDFRDSRTAIAEGMREALQSVPMVRASQDASLLYGVG